MARLLIPASSIVPSLEIPIQEKKMENLLVAIPQHECLSKHLGTPGDGGRKTGRLVINRC